ncbi:MAG TPA: glycosyltransferase family 39 protein [Dehalococcoidia bacterium]
MAARPWVPVLAVAFLLRAAWAAYATSLPVAPHDPWWYDERAQRLAAGLGYTLADGEPTAYFPPGYPLFLAAVYRVLGHHLTAVELIQAALGTASVALLYGLARQAFGARAGLAAAALLAVAPGQILYVSQLHTEVLFTFLALLAVWLTAAGGRREGRPGWLALVAAGAVAGLAALVRGQGLLILPAAGAYLLALRLPWRRWAPRMALTVLAATAVLLPWWVRNAVVLDAFVPLSTNGGVDLWIGNHPGAPGHFWLPDPAVFPQDAPTAERELRWDAIGRREALGYMAAHPLATARAAVAKLYYVFSEDSSVETAETWGRSPFLGTLERGVLSSAASGFLYAVLALAALGAPLWWAAADRPLRLLLLAVPLLWLLTYALVFGDPRFNYPLVPFLCALAAPAVAAVVGAWRARGAPA